MSRTRSDAICKCFIYGFYKKLKFQVTEFFYGVFCFCVFCRYWAAVGMERDSAVEDRFWTGSTVKPFYSLRTIRNSEFKKKGGIRTCKERWKKNDEKVEIFRDIANIRNKRWRKCIFVIWAKRRYKTLAYLSHTLTGYAVKCLWHTIYFMGLKAYNGIK